MKLIDLTHMIAPDMPVYPGTLPPRFQSANTYEKDGFQETLLSFYTHTGTHMDPPAHLYPGGITLDQFPVDQFVGRAAVVECTGLKCGDRIPFSAVEALGEQAEQADFLLFHTGWDRWWGQPEYFGDYPVVDEAIVDYLIRSKKKGVGLDTIGIDPIADTNLTIHKRLFRDNPMVVIENLTNLEKIGGGLCTLFALPLRCENADGSPIRAVAVVEENV